MGMYPPPPPLPPDLTNFVPKAKIITGITQANPAVVTLSANHNYLPGLYISISIPWPNSMPEITNRPLLITILSPTTFSVPVDSTNFQPFVAAPLITVTPHGPPFPPPAPFTVPSQLAQCIPIAEPTQTLVNAEDNIAPL